MKKISLLIRLLSLILLNSLLIACATQVVEREEIKPKEPISEVKYNQDKQENSEEDQTKKESMAEEYAEKTLTESEQRKSKKNKEFTKPENTVAKHSEKKLEGKVNATEVKKAQTNLSEQEMDKGKYAIDTPKKDPSLGDVEKSSQSSKVLKAMKKNNKHSSSEDGQSAKNLESSASETQAKGDTTKSSSSEEKQIASSIGKKKLEKEVEIQKQGNSAKLLSDNKKEGASHEKNLLPEEHRLDKKYSSIDNKAGLDKEGKGGGVGLKGEKGGGYGEDDIYYGVEDPLVIYEKEKKKPPAKTHWNLQRQL